MALRKPGKGKSSNSTTTSSTNKIDAVIEAGGAVPKEAKDDGRVVKFQMVLQGDICDQIDALRKPIGMSRRQWLAIAALEKLERRE